MPTSRFAASLVLVVVSDSWPSSSTSSVRDHFSFSPTQTYGSQAIVSCVVHHGPVAATPHTEDHSCSPLSRSPTRLARPQRNGFGRLFDKGHTDGWSLAINDGNATATLGFVHAASGANFGEWNGPSNAVALGRWHHAAVVFDSDSSANDPELYVDGVKLGGIAERVTPSGVMDPDAAALLYIGNRDANDRTFAGRLDELRLSSVARSADWFGTQYRNQSDPADFLVIGDPQ